MTPRRAEKDIHGVKLHRQTTGGGRQAGRLDKALRAASMGVVVLLAIGAIEPARAEAYLGPGAGFAFVSSFLTIFITLAIGFINLFIWPVRWAIRTMRGWRALKNSRVKRVIILGLDGQDPDLTDRFMSEGLLPNFKRLKEQGSYSRLGTTLLAESPVAWSSFQTGSNPGRHCIYDFLVPNRKSYLPELSSADIRPPSRMLSLGKYQIPLGKPSMPVGRKSKPFWKILGDHGVFSSILRVPITFPPEKFYGVLLSAMCVPDLKGSQGTYFFYTSDEAEQPELTSGVRIAMEYEAGVGRSYLSGPENSLLKKGGEMRLPFEVHAHGRGGQAEIVIDKTRHALPLRKFTPWIEVDFKPGLMRKVRGLCRFYLLDTEPHLRLYVTPIQIDPAKPALPISHPGSYATYLAKTQGAYATLGVAEDTSALNEGILDEDAFLEQTYLIHAERERMYFDAIEKTRRGTVVCVFDITDRLQHMFFRYLVEDHPANRGRDVKKHKDAIKKMYIEMDDLVGRTLEKADDKTVVMVMSDHGFKPFKRGVNLNTWLLRNGFLALKDNPTGADMFADVDWSKTRAYSVGFGGIYLNMAGRESEGIVEPGEEAEKVKREIAEGLAALYDEEHGENPVKKVYDAAKVYSGPYVDQAPDLIAGFRLGYRAAWSAVTGGISEAVIEDNVRPWSGDHNFNPPDVPGILFCNRPIASDAPNIIDVGPTVLDLFGVPVPAFYDGKSFMPAAGTAGERESVSESPAPQEPREEEVEVAAS